MGRSESDSLSAAQIIYPCMQAADIFYLKVNIAQLGTDQRSQYACQTTGSWAWLLQTSCSSSSHAFKPTTTHWSAWPNSFQTWSNYCHENVKIKSQNRPFLWPIVVKKFLTKLKKAYCPPSEVALNPILEYFRYLVFAKYPQVDLRREEKLVVIFILLLISNLKRLT